MAVIGQEADFSGTADKKRHTKVGQRRQKHI
jgi:hypothetical protein